MQRSSGPQASAPSWIAMVSSFHEHGSPNAHRALLGLVVGYQTITGRRFRVAAPPAESGFRHVRGTSAMRTKHPDAARGLHVIETRLAAVANMVLLIP